MFFTELITKMSVYDMSYSAISDIKDIVVVRLFGEARACFCARFMKGRLGSRAIPRAATGLQVGCVMASMILSSVLVGLNIESEMPSVHIFFVS